jgi:hypothetical protein
MEVQSPPRRNLNTNLGEFSGLTEVELAAI